MCNCHEEHRHCECNCHGHSHGKHHGDCQCECGCHEGGHHKHHGDECDCGKHECACEHGERFERRFATRAERVAQLEEYLQDLKAEIQAVEEHLAELKA